MSHRGMSPSRTCYAPAITACARGNEPDMALSLLREMPRVRDRHTEREKGEGQAMERDGQERGRQQDTDMYREAERERWRR